MSTRTVFRIAVGSAIMLFMLAGVANADGIAGTKNYFNSAVREVKTAESPSQKREILDNSLNKMSKALDIVQSSPLISEKDRPGLERFKKALREKQDELTGNNGFKRIPDVQLDAFSDYVLQDMEQAEKYVTISITTLLLAAILLVLLV